MIGYFDYTVWLTYLSAISASIGIVASLSGNGHPYIGTLFLLICGLCDAFDGRVARRKKNRTDSEKNYGIQIDSLSDLVAFGVLPACIGAALIFRSTFLRQLALAYGNRWFFFIGAFVLFAILILYALAAMIRLAYFNVTEEERQRIEGGVRKFYTGLPVTSAALIFPLVLLLQYLTPMDITLVYVAAALATGFAFLSRIQVPKPRLKGILVMIAFGLLEVLALVLSYYFSR